MIATFNSDCIAAMKDMPENSVDSMVTDPPYELGFMGKSWDASGIAFNIEVWQEALRVLKPGGYLLAFSGSRTYHRMAVAIEDAGFEIRDQIMWVYGTGFPKSVNIAKAIDKNLGAPVKVGKAFKVAGEYGNRNLRDSEPQGPERDAMRHTAVTEEARAWEGWGTALKPAHEPIVVARKPLIGTIIENVLTFGTGGMNIEASRITIIQGDEPKAGNRTATFGTQETQSGGDGSGGWEAASGRWPANFIHDGSQEVLDLFPDLGKSTGGRIGKKSMGSVDIGPVGNYFSGDPGFGDSGSAARFFYCAKANKKDRNQGLEVSNQHPTVKPTDLMRYLCRLVTRPGGTVLDPFMGSGSTGKACAYEGFSFIGVDQSEEYVKIANARIEFALKEIQ